MAYGTINVDTLTASTGVLATQNGMTGIAKAWVNFQGGTGNTAGTINGSFNVSSITVNGTGNYTINFTTVMPNANYITMVQGRQVTGSGYTLLGSVTDATPQTTSLVRIAYNQVNTTTAFNPDIAGVAIFSS
jgi:hypothetical protein